MKTKYCFDTVGLVTRRLLISLYNSLQQFSKVCFIVTLPKWK